MKHLLTALVVSAALGTPGAGVHVAVPGQPVRPESGDPQQLVAHRPDRCPPRVLLRRHPPTSRLAVAGAKSYEMVQAARDWANAVDVAVISLGTNDARP